MYNFGAADAHNNQIHFGDLEAVDALADTSVGMFLELLAVCGGNRHFCGKHTGVVGWTAFFTNAEKMYLGVDAQPNGPADTAFTVDATQHSVIVTTEILNFQDGVADGGHAHQPNPPTNVGQDYSLGVTDNLPNSGLACKMGQVMIWDFDIQLADAQMYHAGVTVPQFASLKSWVKGIADPGICEITSTGGTKVGAVTITTEACDSYFLPRAGGFSMMVGHWLAPVIAAGSFGANLMHENKWVLWAYVQKLMGRHFPDMPCDLEAYEMFINQISQGRAVYV